jgi:hypothetical protein
MDPGDPDNLERHWPHFKKRQLFAIPVENLEINKKYKPTDGFKNYHRLIF